VDYQLLKKLTSEAEHGSEPNGRTTDNLECMLRRRFASEKSIMRGPGHGILPALSSSAYGAPHDAGLSALYLCQCAMHKMDRDRTFSNS